MAEAPSPFSIANPKLQRAWDATSLRALQTCPRYYQYSILEGWRQSGVDVEFGGYFASSVEVYKKARLAGLDKGMATLNAVRYAIEATWLENEGDQDGYPWGGHYEEQWRCTGTEPYKNAKGNKAKCPWSHKGHWFPQPGPSTCGECGSDTETERRWIANDNYKDRYSLVRLVSWYCDEQSEELGAQGVTPYAFPDGTPAVELSFTLPLPWKTPNGEPYLLAGHMDSIVSASGEYFIADNKTTKKSLGEGYWAQYAPNIQVDIYDLAGSILYPGLGIRGVLIEGAQVLVDSARFGIRSFPHNDAQREELLVELEWWIKQAEKMAAENYWPMNRSACYICPFKKICKLDPSLREQFLKADFVKKHWNPLEER